MKIHMQPFSVFVILISLAFPLPAMGQNTDDTCVMNSWGRFLDPDPQSFERREVIETESGPIYAIEFAELSGDFAKVFVFLLAGEECFTKAVSHGSYATTNMMATDGRIYHLDLYLPGEHATMGFYDTPLTYDQTRALALEALQ